MTNKEIEETLNEAFRLLKLVVDATGNNLIDNYGYRELTAIRDLIEHLPSIKKTPGRTGDDASALIEGYTKLELKSGTTKGKTLTLKNFAQLKFDKQNESVRREAIFKYDGFGLSVFEYYKPYPTATVFVPKEHVSKIHPVFKEKQRLILETFERKRSEGKNIGRDDIGISLKEILEVVREENLICWLRGNRIDSKDFFHKLNNKEIKINQ
jgi:hypothetical protein